jgi:hypothetical protein
MPPVLLLPASLPEASEELLSIVLLLLLLLLRLLLASGLWLLPGFGARKLSSVSISCASSGTTSEPPAAGEHADACLKRVCGHAATLLLQNPTSKASKLKRRAAKEPLCSTCASRSSAALMQTVCEQAAALLKQTRSTTIIIRLISLTLWCPLDEVYLPYALKQEAPWAQWAALTSKQLSQLQQALNIHSYSIS